MPSEGSRVRVADLESAFFGKRGRVIREMPLDGVDRAYGVRLDGMGAPVPTMTFWSDELEILEPEPPALILDCSRCGLPILTTAEAEHPGGDHFVHAGSCAPDARGQR